VVRWLAVLMLVGSASAHADSAVGYVQGKKIKLAVVDVGGVAVEERTANAFLAMAAAAAEDGIELELTSGFRTNERQAELYKEYRDGGVLAAKPGYSNHQSGRAVDINVWNWTVFEWLDAHAATYGFKRTVKNEPWHWEYRGTSRARKRHASRHPR
jgi:LAS superfamily LD-carboxypeptidase LdcB